MKKKCSKALRARAVGYTNDLFESCVREVLGLKDESKEDLHVAMDFIREAQIIAKIGSPLIATYDEDEMEEMRVAQEKVSNLYTQKIKELSKQWKCDFEQLVETYLNSIIIEVSFYEN